MGGELLVLYICQCACASADHSPFILFCFEHITIQFENSLRRHNHLGTIHALLLAMAQAEILDGAVDNAKTKMTERIKAAREKRAKGESDMQE